MRTALLTPLVAARSPAGYGFENRFSSAQCANEVFGSFEPSLRDRLRPFCDRIAMKPGDVVFGEGHPLHHLYFPESGAIALTGSLASGQTVQVGFVDRHGVAGQLSPNGAHAAPCGALVLLPGTACRLRVDALPFALREDSFRQALNGYLHTQLTAAMRLTVCYTFHSVDQRLARWLLVLNDIAGDEFAITHDTLATMLGVRRPSITLGALSLQDSGAIAYQHGRVRVRNRDNLEGAACECYFSARGLQPGIATEPA